MSILATPIVDKAEREVRVFRDFMRRSGLAIDPATVVSRKPPEPDIRCILPGLGPVAFELVEICNPELAKDIGDLPKRGSKPGFHVVDDPSTNLFLKKIKKSYQTDAPIELLVYTGRTAVPNDLSLPNLRETARTNGIGPFRRVWFLGDKACELVAALPTTTDKSS